MAAGMNATRRFLIRLSLVTGSTVATIVGAQSLASLEVIPTAEALDLPGGETVVVDPVQALIPTTSPDAALLATDSSVSGEAVHAAPSITILRHPGQTGSSGPSNENMALASQNIRPPSPQQLAAPNPIVVQGAPEVIVQPGQVINVPQAAAAAPIAPPPPQTRSSR